VRSRSIYSKADLERIVDDLLSEGYRYLVERHLDLTSKIRPRLVRWLADQGHRKGFRYGSDWGPFFYEFSLRQIADEIGQDVEEEGFQYIAIGGRVDPADFVFWPLDSSYAIEEAREALQEAGLEAAPVWYTSGTFDELCDGEADTVQTQLTLRVNEGRKSA
jgi:8-oxo-dGTP pyrophosphatase MutT (NUDIX family)